MGIGLGFRNFEIAPLHLPLISNGSLMTSSFLNRKGQDIVIVGDQQGLGSTLPGT
jgi:hypothetical protein